MELKDFLKKENIEIQDIKYPIKKIKETQDYVMLFLDDDKIMISIESYFKYDVKNLKGLDDNLYEIFKKEEKILKAYRSCLRKLASKDHSIKQIRDHLKRYDLDIEETDSIINRLINYDLLNDEKYAMNRVSYLQNSSLSNKAILNKLSKEGIDKDLIKKYIIEDDNREYEKACINALKYSKTIKNKSLNSKKQNILSKLISTGFSYENSHRAVEQLHLQKENENELLIKEYEKAKKKYEKKYSDYDLRQKIYASLLSKGFMSDDIKKVMEV